MNGSGGVIRGSFLHIFPHDRNHRWSAELSLLGLSDEFAVELRGEITHEDLAVNLL